MPDTLILGGISTSIWIRSAQHSDSRIRTFFTHTAFLRCCLSPYLSPRRMLVFGIWAQKLCDIYSSIGCALSSFRLPLGPSFDFLFNPCSCQTARCFNKSKRVLITGPKLKAFRPPSLAGGFLCTKKREPLGSRSHTTQGLDYMFSMIASPNSEHFSSLAPSIRRSKS